MDEKMKNSRSGIEARGIESWEKKHTIRRKKRSRRRKRRRICKFLSVLLIAAGMIYFLACLRYRDTFLPNTVIGGIPVSGQTMEEVRSDIESGISGYELVLEERGEQEERIYGRDIGLSPVYDGSLEKILEQQNCLQWGIRLLKGEEYPLKCMVTFDKEKLEAVICGLRCLNPELITEPSDAALSYSDESGVQIVPATKGNSPVRERLYAEIESAVSSLTERISLEEAGIYKEPEVLEDSPELQARKEAWKFYTDAAVTYRFGSRSEIVTGSTIVQWLTEDGAGNVVIDETKVEAFVKELAKKYNTAYCPKELKTSYGKTVTITQGHYGWMIDKAAETNALMEVIQSGKSQEREPVYSQKAASHDGPDYGNTYVEMNLTAQHLYYYKNGRLLIESDFVSGNEAKGWSTPAGAYELTYKQRNAVLRGKNYNTPVTYWMPFNGNIGMHDGYWRSSFGGTIYKKNGSHGCINLPPAVAKTIYENIEAGIPVLCYHLDGTEKSKTTSTESSTAAKSETVQTETKAAVNIEETIAEPGTKSESGTKAENSMKEDAGTNTEDGIIEDTEKKAEVEAKTGSETNQGPGVDAGPGVNAGPGTDSGSVISPGPGANAETESAEIKSVPVPAIEAGS